NPKTKIDLTPQRRVTRSELFCGAGSAIRPYRTPLALPIFHHSNLPFFHIAGIDLQENLSLAIAEKSGPFNLGWPERRSNQWYTQCHQRALPGINRLQSASGPEASVRY